MVQTHAHHVAVVALVARVRGLLDLGPAVVVVFLIALVQGLSVGAA